MPPQPPPPRFDGDPGASAGAAQVIALLNDLLIMAQFTIGAQAQRIRDLERTNKRQN